MLEIKDFKKRSKKVASLTTHTIDDNIVMRLDVHERITLAQRSTVRKEFLNLFITKDETLLDIKQKYKELLRTVTVEGGVINARSRLESLQDALPEKYDIVRVSSFLQTPAVRITSVFLTYDTEVQYDT